VHPAVVETLARVDFVAALQVGDGAAAFPRGERLRRLAVEISFDDGGSEEGLVYIATEDNAAILGEAPERDIARQIASSAGPSGRNRDYLIELADALRALGKDDPHVFAIERHLSEFY
jgi:cation transport protein ChaC